MSPSRGLVRDDRKRVVAPDPMTHASRCGPAASQTVPIKPKPPRPGAALVWRMQPAPAVNPSRDWRPGQAPGEETGIDKNALWARLVVSRERKIVTTGRRMVAG